MSKLHDVLIVGAGPGGSAAAHYLAQRGLDVLLCDKAEFPRDKTCGDGLTPRALAVLEDMGVLETLEPSACRIGGLEIVAPNEHVITAPMPQRTGVPDYALVVPRRVLDATLRQHAAESGATLMSSVHVTNLEPGPDEVVLRAERNGHELSARGRMAVVATGAGPKLLLRMGVLKRTPPMMVAARAYLDGVEGLSDRLQLRFDGVPLPGYGWLFPLSDASANVGVGLFTSGRAGGRRPASPQKAYRAFVGHPSLQPALSAAREVGPVKGYPLRADFGRAPTYAERVVLVGEAAGLVNPLSGEGVDYALESGKLAAEYLAGVFAGGDLSADLATYDRLLRGRFGSLFRFCNRLRDLAVNRPALDRLVAVAARREDLKMKLIDIVFGNESPPGLAGQAGILTSILLSRR